MEFWKAIVMGIIQGVAEFLPISSSGHLAIFKHILNIQLDTGLLFDVMLHFGTLLAVFVCFWKDIRKLVVEGCGILKDFFINIGHLIYNLKARDQKKEIKKVVNTAYRKFVMMILISTIPTGILGVLLSSTIEKASAGILVPGICLLVTGGLLLIADYTKKGIKRPNQISYGEAGIVGIAQGVATLPGLSRSGTTITACLLCGFDKNFAVKYSFIMSIPAILGAMVLEIKDFAAIKVTSLDIVNYAMGTMIAAVVGYICIKTMLVVVRGKKFFYFALYCFLVGTIAIVWNFAG